MAHKLNFNKQSGTWSFTSHAEKAWHGLGQIVEKSMTAEEAIKNANLDYEVSKTTIHGQFQTENGIIYTAVPNRFVTYRTDTNDILGMVSDRYEIVQNRDAFKFFDAIIDSGEAIFETAGVIGNGERIFVTAKLPEDMLVNGEKCEKYIILTNSHDGSSALLAGFTSVRIVCNNTLQAALSDLSNKVSIRHNGSAKDNLKEAYRVMGIASSYMSQVSELFNEMANTKITDEGLRKYIMDVMKPEFFKDQAQKDEISTRLNNTVDEIYNFAKIHHTQQTPAAAGTVWGAYNAISGYYNYAHSFRSDSQKFESQMFGAANKKMLKSFEQALVLL